jgi:cell fate (sporulation/competence/biofilm development) regulator YmcA (YheA/YmcA/DUF963 family)
MTRKEILTRIKRMQKALEESDRNESYYRRAHDVANRVQELRDKIKQLKREGK